MLARLIAAIAFLAVASSSVLTAQSHAAGDHPAYALKFYPIGAAQPVHIDGYTFTVIEIPDSAWETRLHAFIQAPADPQPRQFYSYGRGTDVALVPECHLVVIGDDYTTKLVKLVAVSLPDLKQTNLSDDAVAQYRKSYDAGWKVYANASSIAVSHDCNRVLVEVSVMFSGATTPEEADAAAKRYPKRSYEVSPTSGKVLQVLPAD